ncbi:MAG: hypothetical protein AAGC95_00245 [Pseudomonadota bacterium]
MTTVAYSLLTVVFSTMFLLQLRRIDPKRARVLDRDTALVFGGTSKPLFWGLVFAPAIMLLSLGDIAALVVWFAAITVIGWLISLQHPKRDVLSR